MSNADGQAVRDAVVAMITENSGRSKVSIIGTSMAPLLRAGMIAEIEPLGTRSAKPGDILVYRTVDGLVAHRLLKIRGEAYVTCGDAHPDNLEFIGFRDVLGRVTRVWRNADPAAKRVDDVAFYVAGQLIRAARPIRVLLAQLKYWGVFAFSKPRVDAAFRSLVLAAVHFERGEYESAMAAVRMVGPAAFFDTVSRHGMTGFLLRWLESSEGAGKSIPPSLLDACRRARWATALMSEDTIALALSVSDCLEGSGISPIFLKGAARMLRDDVDADLHYSCDVDVLVSGEEASAAVDALRLHGYKNRDTAQKIDEYDKYLHHKAPLWPPVGIAPVEVHVTLCIPSTVSERLDHEALSRYSRIVRRGDRSLHVFDDVGTALHLAYHGRDFRAFRDVVLLARMLRGMNVHDRREFDRLVSSERHDAVRLSSVVSVACALNSERPFMSRAVASYITWALVREDFPIALAKRSDTLETFIARGGFYYRGPRYIPGQVARFLFNVVATPTILRWMRASLRKFGKGASIFD